MGKIIGWVIGFGIMVGGAFLFGLLVFAIARWNIFR